MPRGRHMECTQGGMASAAPRLELIPCAPAESVRPLPEDTLVPRPGETTARVVTSSGMRWSWQARPGSESLGSAVFIAAAQLGLERESDSAGSVCSAIGRSPLRAAAWLRSRGAAIGHAVSRRRLQGPAASLYQLASETPVGKQRERGAVSFGRIDSSSVARWMRNTSEHRVAIMLVGPSWPTCRGTGQHAVVAVHASDYAFTLFDPAGHGSLDELRFGLMDRLREEADTHGEVLLIARRS